MLKKILIAALIVFVSQISIADTVLDTGDVQYDATGYSGAADGATVVTANYTDATFTNPVTRFVNNGGLDHANLDFAPVDMSHSKSLNMDIYGDGSGSSMRISFWSAANSNAFLYKDIAITWTGWQSVSWNLDGTLNGFGYWANGGTATRQTALTSINAFSIQPSWNAKATTFYIDNVFVYEVPGAQYDPRVNLVSNGDAESTIDFQSWYHAAAPYTYMCRTDSATEGTSSFEFATDINYAGAAELRSLLVPAEPNQPFILKFSYKTLAGFAKADAAGLWVQCRSWSGTNWSAFKGQSWLALEATNGQWVEMELEFTANSDATVDNIDVSFNMNLFAFAGGVVRFDDIALYDNTATVVKSPVNLLDNGGFELGNFTGWNTTNNVSITGAVVKDGNYALQCDTTGVSEIVHDGVAVNAGEKVWLDADFMTVVGASAPVASSVQIRFYGASGLISYYWIDIAATNGQWTHLTNQYKVPTGATIADVYIRIDTNALAYIDNVALHPQMAAVGPFEQEHLNAMAQQWLGNDYLPLEADNVWDNFEGFASQIALEDSWGLSSGSYANRGTATITLMNNSAAAHSGSKFLRFAYNNNFGTDSWTEFNRMFDSPVDMSKYNELHIWMNRQAGNSDEAIFYIKFYNGGLDESHIVVESWIVSAEGSTYSPTGWTEWVIDLDSSDLTLWRNGVASKADLTDVQGFFFGVWSDSASGDLGSGVIDFDDIYLVNTVPNCGTNPPSMDLNGDCVVNFEDYSTLANFWMAE